MKSNSEFKLRLHPLPTILRGEPSGETEPREAEEFSLPPERGEEMGSVAELHEAGSSNAAEARGIEGRTERGHEKRHKLGGRKSSSLEI